MQTVPSLVGTGAAIAAASSGLVFGQPPPPPPTTNTSTNATTQDSTARTLRRSHQRTISVDRALPANFRPTSSVCARPLTTTAAPSIADEHSHHRTVSHPQTSSRPPLSRHQRPQSSQFTSPRSSSRRLSFARPGELSPSVASAGPRDSVLSNGSWMRRMSVRPLSQSNSNRSSLIADTTSVTFSNGSAAPILFRPNPTAPPLPPNKLVKRISTSQNDNGAEDISPRWRHRGPLPTLRRPATSHQRSATLQQFRADIDVAGSLARPKYPFEQPIGPEELLGASPFDDQVFPGARPESGWASFFHSRTTRIAASGSVQGHISDASSPPRDSFIRKICPESVGQDIIVHLIKPRMISASLASVGASLAAPADIHVMPEHQSSQAFGGLMIPPEHAPRTRTRRSLSESLSSATNWVSKRSGSLRRSKRGLDRSGSASRRHVSEPTESSTSQVSADANENASPSEPPTKVSSPPKVLQDAAHINSALTIRRQSPMHQVKRSSPPPGHSIVVYGVGSLPRPVGLSRGGTTTTRHVRPNQPSGSSTSSAVLSQFARGSQYERSSVMESSDGDARGFASGDDDDFDFKSDTMFDSLRTLSSSRARAVETPLESVYDESPPSTAGNGRTKRLSVQEMLARGWDEGDKIMEEEDESMSTPVRPSQHAVSKPSQDDRGLIIVEPHSGSESPHDEVKRLTENLERCSMDGFDDDEDWTRDDDVPSSSPLSPPSTSLGSKGMNPNVRLALASIEGETLPRPSDQVHRIERPLSNLFEWSETSMHDKHDGGGISMRPRTAYAMPEMDSRGGRSAIRRGPTPTHVRSQSVPVVHDSVALSKPTGPKYGTWGMGAKTVSEDWDEDFEFGGGGGECNGDAAGKSQDNAFAVPESIRATQPSVRAHSGQIRELSLLVNDLKRLCRHGRELNMLNGDQTGLWREAEGIIALASPDEDDEKDDHQSSAYLDHGSRDVKGLPVETRPDQFDAAFDSPEPAMRKTAVVRERQSPRRRSVFSPEDDIFGGSWPLAESNGEQPSRVKQPRTPDSRTGDVSGVVRSVMESMRQHHRASTEPPREPRPPEGSNGRVQFDTNSLKALVKRAGELRDVLSDAIRRADQITQSPAATPRRERRLESSPAFTRVFDDPGSSPLRRTTKSRGANSLMESTPSPDKSPSSPMSPQMPLMTVG